MKLFSLRKLFKNKRGNFGHKGRLGLVGGSLPGSSGRSGVAKKEVSSEIESAKSFDESLSKGFFGVPRSHDDFIEGGPGLHRGEIMSSLETKVLSIDGDRTQVKTDYNFGSFAARVPGGSQPKVGNTVKLIQEQKKGPKGNISTWNYIATQSYK